MIVQALILGGLLTLGLSLQTEKCYAAEAEANQPTTIRIFNHQSPDGISCQNGADELLDSLKNTGFSPTAATCEAVSITTRQNIVVAFSGKAPTKVSTYESKFYSQKGFYRSLADCRKNLIRERQDFLQYTGLEPLYSQCALEASYDRYPYYAHLVGFGDPKQVPLRRRWFSGIPIVADKGRFTAALRDHLASYGATLTHLAFRNELLAGGATIQLYANPSTGEFRTDATYLVEIAGFDRCLRAVETLGDQLGLQEPRTQTLNSSFKPITAYCQASTFRGYYDVNLAFLQDRRIKTHYSTRTFPSLTSCTNSRQEETDLASAINPGMTAVANVCGSRPYSSEARNGIYRVAVLLAEGLPLSSESNH